MEPTKKVTEPSVDLPLASNASIILSRRGDVLFRRLSETRRRATERRIHDLRVASRRLRECLTVFRQILGGAGYRKPLRAARRLTEMLGDIRNLDVAREILRPVVKESAGTAEARAARRYSSHLAREARGARARLVENLRLYKCEPLERGLRDLQASFKIHPAAPLSREMVRAVLLRRMAAVFGLKSKALAPSNETAQHRLRIALKKTRYRIEVLDFAFGETGARILTKIQGLQDVLGNLHDLDVLLGNLREWARQNSLEAKHPGASKDLDALAAHLSRKRNALHRAFARRFRPLERRRLLADLMNDLRL